MDLAEIEAIKQLKYRYFRFLDTKSWDEIAECFAEDATCSYDEGRYRFEGRERIVAFLRNALGRPGVVTMHHGHHPEIALTGETTATGTWYLEDLVLDASGNTALRGAAFYRDEYLKVDGRWKLRSTGYRRTWEEVIERRGVKSLRTMFDAA